MSPSPICTSYRCEKNPQRHAADTHRRHRRRRVGRCRSHQANSNPRRRLHHTIGAKHRYNHRLPHTAQRRVLAQARAARRASRKPLSIVCAHDDASQHDQHHGNVGDLHPTTGFERASPLLVNRRFNRAGDSNLRHFANRKRHALARCRPDLYTQNSDKNTLKNKKKRQNKKTVGSKTIKTDKYRIYCVSCALGTIIELRSTLRFQK